MWCLRPWVSRVIRILTILLMGYIAWGSMQSPEALWAPGHLSRHHADLKKCDLCHQEFKGATNDKCLACHSAKVFQTRSDVATSQFHQKVIDDQQSCLACHTEHRGVLASITRGSIHNPHGEFIFRATGASSCSDCHTMKTGKNKIQSGLLQNARVRHLIEEGEGAHQLGKFATCLKCHVGGQLDIEEEDDHDD